MGVVKINFPHDGDVLTRGDGRETPESLTIRVQGAVPEGAGELSVNGTPATSQGTLFSCDVALRERRNTITVRGGGKEQTLDVWWKKGGRKQYRFSVDDNIQFLKDLGTNPDQYPSLFNHWYLGFWRDLHREFGLKLHLNIYYQTDGFDLTQMPEKWKEEWQANADWLHLSFHALQDKPDRPYRNARYAQLAHDFDLVTDQIRRFAGNEVLSSTTTLHWAECPKDAVAALRDRGIETLIALFQPQGYAGPCTTGYYLSREQCAYCDTRSAWHDRETGLTFIRCTAVINAIEAPDIVPYLDAHTATPATAEMAELLIHEQYFRKDLDLYQPTVMEKVRTALEWVSQRGYEPVFWCDGFLGGK
ncbi:MAG TPA: hypothetical protein PLI09_13790 [Candidatus Hydrogenedentes bacterium]|nr:hypothetical protein [Candidatus Hydrogenedentota bacterium]